MSSSDSASSRTYSDGASLSRSDEDDEDGIFGLDDRGREDEGVSLSANSSEWTPLLGPDLLGLTPQERRGEWSTGSADEQVEFPGFDAIRGRHIARGRRRYLPHLSRDVWLSMLPLGRIISKTCTALHM